MFTTVGRWSWTCKHFSNGNVARLPTQAATRRQLISVRRCLPSFRWEGLL